MAENRLEFVNANLPAQVRAQGGAIVEVLSERFPELQPIQIRSIGILVGQYSSLNTEHAVDVLAWSVVFHHVDVEPWFAELVDTWGLERVHLALECCYDLGVNEDTPRQSPVETAVGTIELEHTDRGTLHEVLALIKELEAADFLPETPEEFDGCLTSLGGWEVAQRMEAEEIANILMAAAVHGDRGKKEFNPHLDGDDATDFVEE